MAIWNFSTGYIISQCLQSLSFDRFSSIDCFCLHLSFFLCILSLSLSLSFSHGILEKSKLFCPVELSPNLHPGLLLYTLLYQGFLYSQFLEKNGFKQHLIIISISDTCSSVNISDGIGDIFFLKSMHSSMHPCIHPLVCSFIHSLNKYFLSTDVCRTLLVYVSFL